MLYQLDEKQILLDYIESERGSKRGGKKTAFRILKAGLMSVEETAKCCSPLSVEEVKQSSEQEIQTD